ncbi:xanthine dehydrogenase family protein subunit M [bacterium]|nr:xanthine dehydrogenase family protein subunit M [bacterium]
MTPYVRPANLSEAIALAGHGYRPLAGGTDLYPGAGRELSGPVLDLTALSELRGFDATHGLRIGACTSWAAIAEASLPPALRALQQAALQVGGRQIQNAGTIGGNICNASPAADGIPPLLALNAELEFAGPGGKRRIALEQALLGPRKIARAPDEILIAVHIPAAALTGRSAFRKLGARSHLVISIVMAAVNLRIEAGRIMRARIAVGSCAPTARRLPGLEQALTGMTPDQVVIDPALVIAALSPLDDIRATAAYRSAAVVTLLSRLIRECGA